MRREYWSILAAACIGLPALYCRLAGLDFAHSAPVLGMILFGVAIIGAAFLLTWGAELAELEMSPNLALVVLALVAVLPEYAVDIYLSWSAGTWAPVPGATGDGLINVKQGLALANMTGANRILIGLGWPVVVWIGWRTFGRRSIQLELARSGDIFWLGVVTCYSIIIPLKGTITIVDTLILLAMYGAYLWCASKVPAREPHLQGPAALIGQFPRPRRVQATWAFFGFAAAVIFASSEPFAESLIASGTALGIDEFLLVQWLAPFASESPEFLAVILLSLKGAGTDGLGALVSSKVNQWSLLVGMVPLAFALGHLHTYGVWQGGFELDARQTEELVLTTAQSLYAITTIMSYRFRLVDAGVLFTLFAIQIGGTIGLESAHLHRYVSLWHYIVAAFYLVLATVNVAKYSRFLPAIYRGAIYLDAETYHAAMTGNPAPGRGATAPGAPVEPPADPLPEEPVPEPPQPVGSSGPVP